MKDTKSLFIAMTVFFVLLIVCFSVFGALVGGLNHKIDQLALQVNQIDTESETPLPSPSPISTVIKSPPLASKISSSALEFYGDSITTGFRVDPSKRWSALVSSALKKTENNYGLSGHLWLHAATNIFDHHEPGNSSFFMYGVNDMAQGDIYLYEIKRTIYAFLLYATLPQSNIVNARAATFNADAWEPTGAYSKVGLMTLPVDGSQSPPAFPNKPSITATVTGRYIGFSTTVISTNNLNDNSSFAITLDGQKVEETPTPFFVAQQGIADSIVLVPQLWIYDTGATGNSHTIELVPSVNNNFGDRACVDYFFGFDTFSSSAPNTPIPSFLIEPTSFDYITYNKNSPHVNTNMAAYNTMLKEVVQEFNVRFGLPVTLITETLRYELGALSFDLVHPLEQGHRLIANRILKILNE